MTTRRALLTLAGASVIGAFTPTVGACTRRTAEPAPRVFLTTAQGVCVFDGDGRAVRPPTPVAVATPDWAHAVVAQPDGAGTRIVVEDLASRQVRSSYAYPDRLEPRIITDDGRLVASVTPGGAGIYGLHEPGGRERTTVVVSTGSRLDLPGNLEPDAFSPDGERLFLLDYLPAGKPDRFRLRAVEVANGRPVPLPPGAETELRAHRVGRVHDARRALLFSLYTYEPDRIAFVHCLHLGEGWTRRIDLPAPFGQQRPGVHALAQAPGGDRLCVVHAPSALVADLDPDALAVRRVAPFAANAQEGKPNPALTALGRLVVLVDGRLIATDPARDTATPGPARGLVLGARDDVWCGHPGGVVRYDLGSGRELGRFAVPGLYVVKHVRAG